MDDTHISADIGTVKGVKANIVFPVSIAEQSVRHKAAAKSCCRILQGSQQLIQMESDIGLYIILSKGIDCVLVHIVFCFQKNKGLLKQDFCSCA